MSDLTITATVLTETGTPLTTSRQELAPVGVMVKGTGNMSHSAIREVAVEALESFAGTYESGFMVDPYPSFHEKAEDVTTIFPVVKVS